MKHDPQPAADGPGDSFSPDGQEPDFGLAGYGDRAITTYTYYFTDGPPEPPWRVEHDQKQGVFHITGPEGQAASFRDKPVRYLVVERDEKTGELTPVLEEGAPWILHLCRLVIGH